VLDLKKSNSALFDEFKNYLIKKNPENPPTDSQENHILSAKRERGFLN
jgi:hypothetical protein